eukprot:gb/GEZN01006296.1/.p1 GENE.gb/GEZN01006296.1/~~gb/GEZN01006296.1/.p1  ORF type:complete len:537 (-),score=37.15 gb/GEZN01006296.1/:29-1639(-)
MGESAHGTMPTGAKGDSMGQPATIIHAPHITTSVATAATQAKVSTEELPEETSAIIKVDEADAEPTEMSEWQRWLIVIGAVCIHLSIGQVYSFSVFYLPLTKLEGVTSSMEGKDWTYKEVGWIFSVAIVCLGLSAAFGGPWLERVGPPRAMFVSALCFSGGFFVSALAVDTHQLWLIYVGYGLLSGTGMGLGYISPVSSLVKSFTRRPGFATGTAIMGFGGGAIIAAPLSRALITAFTTPTSNGVWQSFLVLGVIYFVMMMIGTSLTAYVCSTMPKNLAASISKTAHANTSSPGHCVTNQLGHKTSAEVMYLPQFYLLWCVLFFNVTAGIGLLSQASPMIQFIFPEINPQEAASFVSILSLLNMVGRLIWSSISDCIGRKSAYFVFTVFGCIAFVVLPLSFRNLPLFYFLCCMIISFYGGGFATLPAYITDLFGATHVSAIHGRVLTAWSVAGVTGPTIMSSLTQRTLDQGGDKRDSYTLIMHIMSVLLAVAALANFLIFPVTKKRDVQPMPPPSDLMQPTPSCLQDFAQQTEEIR